MWWRTYTTSLSSDEAQAAIRQLLNTRSKILFFSISNCYGSIKDRHFWISGYNAPFGFLIPRLKGVIRSENPTIIETRMSFPLLMIFMLVVVPAYFLSDVVTAETMTINGVSREPELFERLVFSLVFIGVPLILLYTNMIWPTKKIERLVKEKLKLERI